LAHVYNGFGECLRHFLGQDVPDAAGYCAVLTLNLRTYSHASQAALLAPGATVFDVSERNAPIWLVLKGSIELVFSSSREIAIRVRFS
jgi:hypothetical protein